MLDLTIILPIRNEREYISSALDSILNQTKLDKYEIIISDGCSNDGTLDIVYKYISNNSNIHLIENPSKIVSTGFNLALNEAKGDIIIRMDGHCEITQNYIKKCYNLLKETDADIVGGFIETISTGLVGKAISIAQSSWFGVGGVKFRSKKLVKASYVDTLAFGAHRRKIFADIGGYDEEMVCNQDDEFNHRAIQSGKKIWMDPSIKTKYFSRSTFSRLFKQYFNYGCYKVRGIQKRRQIISMRQLIPSIFVMALMVTLISGYILQQPWISFSLLLIYLIINFISSFIGSQKISLSFFIFFSFWILHIGYGLGFMWGLFRFLGKWGDNSLKDDHFNKERFIANGGVSS